MTDHRGFLLRTVVSLEPHNTLMESMRIALRLLRRCAQAERPKHRRGLAGSEPLLAQV